MISVIICRPESSGVWEIDTWLMSCRVLGRRVEQMVLKKIVQLAAVRGIERLLGVYKPTDRNQLVEHHYANLGFTQTRRDEDGSTFWELKVADAPIEEAPMIVHSFGFD